LPGFHVIAGLKPLEVRTLIAESHSIGPTYLLYRILVSLPTGRILSADSLVLILSYQVLVYVE